MLSLPNTHSDFYRNFTLILNNKKFNLIKRY